MVLAIVHLLVHLEGCGGQQQGTMLVQVEWDWREVDAAGV